MRSFQTFWKGRKDLRKIIGITGKSGSGKSTVAKKIGEVIPNSTVIEVDTIGHEALCRPNILENLIVLFGSEILDDLGNVDRKKLGNIVFAERKKMKELSSVTYTYITQKIAQIIDEAHNGVVILDWILLPVDPAWQKCDFKILIETDPKLRKEKVILRDNISESYFNAREKTSIEYDKSQFDFVFSNDYSFDTLENIVTTISSLM